MFLTNNSLKNSSKNINLNISSVVLVFSSCLLVGSALAVAKDNSKIVNKTKQTQNSKSKTKKYNDWYYRCLDQNKSAKTKKITAKQCEVLQVAQVKTPPKETQKKTDAEKNVSVLTLAFSRGLPKKGSKKRGVLLTVLTPLNIHLPSGFTLTVDKKKPFNIAYRNCNQAGCWVNAELQEKHLNYMKKGKSGFGQMRLLNGQNVRIKFSLKGLESALAALEKEVVIN